MSETIDFDYKGKNSNNYKIISETTKEDTLFLSIVDSKNGDVYSSNYYLTNLNEKFLNIIKFKKIKVYVLQQNHQTFNLKIFYEYIFWYK